MLFTDRTESNHRYWTIELKSNEVSQALEWIDRDTFGQRNLHNALDRATYCFKCKSNVNWMRNVTRQTQPTTATQQRMSEWAIEKEKEREREQREAILLRILYITLHLITLITLQTVIQSCCSICLHLIVIETWLAAWCPRRNVFILFNQKRHIIQYRSFRLIHTRPTKKICDNEFHEAIGQDPAIQY